MASKSTNKTLVTLAVVAVLLFAAWKLIPALISKLTGGGQSSGTAGGGGVGYGGEDGYGGYEGDDNNGLLNGIANALSHLGLGGGSGGGSKAGSGSAGGSGSGSSFFGPDLYDSTGTQFNPDLGSTLGNYDPNSADTSLAGYQIGLEPLQDLQLTGVPVGSGIEGSDSSSSISQSTGLAPDLGSTGDGYADVTGYTTDATIGDNSGDSSGDNTSADASSVYFDSYDSPDGSSADDPAGLGY